MSWSIMREPEIHDSFKQLDIQLSHYLLDMQYTLDPEIDSQGLGEYQARFAEVQEMIETVRKYRATFLESVEVVELGQPDP